jgi:hypothetical protein
MGIRTHQGGEIVGDRTLHTYMLMWLQEAKVIDIGNNYQVNEATFLTLCGVSRGLLEDLRQLTRPQRDFLGILRARSAEDRTWSVKSVKDEMTKGPRRVGLHGIRWLLRDGVGSLGWSRFRTSSSRCRQPSSGSVRLILYRRR